MTSDFWIEFMSKYYSFHEFRLIYISPNKGLRVHLIAMATSDGTATHGGIRYKRNIVLITNDSSNRTTGVENYENDAKGAILEEMDTFMKNRTVEKNHSLHYTCAKFRACHGSTVL